MEEISDCSTPKTWKKEVLVLHNLYEKFSEHSTLLNSVQYTMCAYYGLEV